MSQTITRLFDRYADAHEAVTDLELAGVNTDDISLIAHNSDGVLGSDDVVSADIGKGATTGGLIGGAGGLLAGVGLIAIPGLGPVVAAGWLVSMLLGAGVGAAAGAATGGLVGVLQEHGETEDDAHVYAEAVRRGSTLVSAKVPDELIDEAEAILARNRSVEAAARAAKYKAAGWSRFDDKAPHYTAEEIEAERRLHAPAAAGESG